VIAYVIRRIVQSFFVLLIVMLFTFSLPYFQDHGIVAPAYAVLGTKASPANVAYWAKTHGMDATYFHRFWTYATQLFFHFNLGRSYKQNSSVWGIISLYVPRTIWLAAVSLALTTIIAIPLGIYQASRRNTFGDYTATGVAFVLYAMPNFLLAMLLLDAFSFHWPHLPNSPPSGIQAWAMFTDPAGFILPVAALTSGLRTLFKHAFRNALGPIIVLLGLSIPALLGGALIIESVFNYEGLGIQTVDAANNLDLPTVLGITLLVAILTLLGNLLADVALGLVNPRIRIEGNSR
jgi:peptide/nickel transport system permease protein